MNNPMLKAQKYEGRVTTKVTLDYLLFLPQDYKPRSPKRWPLILFLHGAGERGTNVWLVAKHGPPKIVKGKPDFPFIVVSPQCPPRQWWTPESVLALLENVTGKYKVDPQRIYLTGLSMGGYGTWSLGLAHPERFAAIAPICGGGEPLGIEMSQGQHRQTLKNLPVWVFHGAKDPVVKLEESERMVNALRRIGNDAKLTVYPDAEHDSWTATYSSPELYDWFLQHKRKSGGKKR